MEKTIYGGSARYLSELPEFQDGLPHGIVNKTKTDVGGTYVAANCRSNYIIQVSQVPNLPVLIDKVQRND